jgi:hypothetical protein
MTKKVVIELLDEVNAKLHGLSTATRRKLQGMFSYMLPHAFHVPAYKMGRWDGKVNFFTFGALTYINLLEDIVPVLIDEGYEISIEDQRVNYGEFKFEDIEDDHFSHKVWPEGHPIAGEPVVLRDYQVEIINNFLRNPSSIQEIATGAGKTLITAALSNLVEDALDDQSSVMHKIVTGTNRARTLVIVPNKGLVTQTEDDYVNLGLDVGVYFGDRKELGHTHTICTWQSLESIRKRWQDGTGNISLEDFSEGVLCVIADECFDKDTLILTPNGHRKISDLRPGDKVINLDETGKCFKEDTVVKLHENLIKSQTEEMLELEFDDSSIIRVTANHEFLTNQGWIRADQLTEEMEVIDINTYNKR